MPKRILLSTDLMNLFKCQNVMFLGRFSPCWIPKGTNRACSEQVPHAPLAEGLIFDELPERNEGATSRPASSSETCPAGVWPSSAGKGHGQVQGRVVAREHATGTGWTKSELGRLALWPEAGETNSRCGPRLACILFMCPLCPLSLTIRVCCLNLPRAGKLQRHSHGGGEGMAVTRGPDLVTWAGPDKPLRFVSSEGTEGL